MPLISVNPATEAVEAEYQYQTDDTLDGLLTQAAESGRDWRAAGVEERAVHLTAVAAMLRERKSQLAELMAAEMGKPRNQGEAEAEKCAWACEHFAGHGAGFLEPDRLAAGARKTYVDYQPLGVILAIMPWNFPLWQVFRFGVGALMAGNTAIVKHAPNVTGCALAVEALFLAAGLPPGVVRCARATNAQTAGMIADPRVRAVTFTGSCATGRIIAAQAGEALKKCVLELGGSDPYVVLEDADISRAARICADSRCVNSGQSCIAAKRFIAVESVYAAFEEAFLAEMAGKQLGFPAENPDLGPLARKDLRETLDRQVRESAAKGARVLMGGQIPERPGWWYPPTALTDVTPGQPAFHEELFGPVATLFRARDENEAAALANATSFGLGAAVFTQDVERGEAFARGKLDAGSCFVNASVQSDPRMPFGGIKDSGYGRELGLLGAREFTNAKTVYVAE